jgi:protein-S-isoprenylcysteine O-methyltransferase Ste14
MIYDLPNPFDIIILVPQFISLAGIIWSLKYFSLFEFAGISQVMRWKNNRYSENELDEKLTLRIEGPYKYSRHPLYFFIIAFMFFRPAMNLFYLVFTVCTAAYFYIGSVYEERKLTEVFGELYRDYIKTVPRIIPVSFGKREK